MTVTHSSIYVPENWRKAHAMFTPGDQNFVGQVFEGSRPLRGSADGQGEAKGSGAN
jgi:hypothetical protein